MKKNNKFKIVKFDPLTSSYSAKDIQQLTMLMYGLVEQEDKLFEATMRTHYGFEDRFHDITSRNELYYNYILARDAVTDDIVGFLSYLPVNKHEKIENRSMSIHWLYVLPSYRCIGIAGKMIAEILEEAKEGKASICISCAANNQNAYKLYKKLGFNDYLHSMILVNS